MTIPEGVLNETQAPPTEYNSYVLGADYVEGYLANFRQGVRSDIDLNDPELAARLDMSLNELLERGGIAQGLPPSALQTTLLVRDVVALGVLESINELPYVDEDQEAAISEAVEGHLPEIPLINGLAPVDVARWLYDDPRDIPLSARSGRKLTVGSVSGTDQEIHYSLRIAALTSNGPVIDIMAPQEDVLRADGNAGSDALIVAIEDVTHTMGDDAK